MRYYSLNSFLKNKFGEKVYRISVDAGFTCPNRDGSKGTGGCIYCSGSGAGAAYASPGLSVPEQIRKGIEIVGKRYGTKKFIAYFQPFSNTYGRAADLLKLYKSALGFPEICGIAIGTRPDCIDEEKIEMLNGLSQETFLIVEYGAQSMHDKTLEKINRCHSAEENVSAVKMTVKSGRIHTVAHLILGLPGESEPDMIESVSELIGTGINGFKFHHLYVENGTALEKEFMAGNIPLLGRDEYIEILAKIIRILPDDIVIHRLFSDSSPDRLIAPLWTLNKQENMAVFQNALAVKGITQGMDRMGNPCGGNRH